MDGLEPPPTNPPAARAALPAAALGRSKTPNATRETETETGNGESAVGAGRWPPTVGGEWR